MARVPRVTPEEFASRWGSGLKSSVERIRSGVEKVTVSPGKSAADKADKWHAAISSQSVKQKWARRIGAMTLEDWQRAMTTKGVGRIATGVDEAQPKMAAFGEKLLAHQTRLMTEIDQMPDVTLEDSINRMTAWVRGMSKLEV